MSHNGLLGNEMHYRRTHLGIFAGAILLLETQEQRAAPLPPPQIRLNPHQKRTPNNERDFTLSDMTGRPIHIADLKGKVVLLNFFATWCQPCVDEMPSIQNL